MMSRPSDSFTAAGDPGVRIDSLLCVSLGGLWGIPPLKEPIRRCGERGGELDTFALGAGIEVGAGAVIRGSGCS